jgi:hypothetical protein
MASIVGLPDSNPLTLTYSTDPTNPNSPTATCTNPCTLAHDPNVPFQDFLFDEPQMLTGFQMVVTGFYGRAAGLHLLQVLSSGTNAFADQSLNGGSCTSGLGAQGGVSSSTTQGTWTPATMSTVSVPGAQQTVLESTQQGSSVTWSPYIAADGQYEMSLFTPGCASYNTIICSSRTTVTVVVQPGGQTTTINQNSNSDLTTTIFSGQLTAGNPVTVTLTNAGGGTAIADHIQVTASNPGAPRGTTAAHGLFEWVLDSGNGDFGDGVPGATSASTSNATGLDRVAQHLGANAHITSLATPPQYVFAVGSFNYTPSTGTASISNVLAYDGPNSSPPTVPGGGLAGNVAASVAYNGYLYVAGSFVATADGSMAGLGGIARWQYSPPSSSSWQPIPGSGFPTGGIQDLVVATVGQNPVILAVGNGGNGVAAYDPSAQQWGKVDNFIVGGLTTASNSSDGGIYLAGSVQAAMGYAAPGGAMLEDGKNGASITPMNFSLNPASASSALSRRSETGWKANVRSLFGLGARATPPVSLDLPSSLDASSSQVLAGAFWANSSADNKQTVLIGGQFTTTDGISNIGSYDASGDGSLEALPNCDVEGTIKALEVVGNMLWIGGNVTAKNGGAQGVVTYDLVNNQLSGAQTKLARTFSPFCSPVQAADGLTLYR